MEGILAGTEPTEAPTVTAGRGSSSRHPYPPEWSTSSAANETRPGGIGSDYSRDPEAATEPTEPGTVAVTGMVMESLPEEGRAPSISGAPLMGIVLVLFILLAIGAGFRRR